MVCMGKISPVKSPGGGGAVSRHRDDEVVADVFLHARLERGGLGTFVNQHGGQESSPQGRGVSTFPRNTSAIEPASFSGFDWVWGWDRVRKILISRRVICI